MTHDHATMWTRNSRDGFVRRVLGSKSIDDGNGMRLAASLPYGLAGGSKTCQGGVVSKQHEARLDDKLGMTMLSHTRRNIAVVGARVLS